MSLVELQRKLMAAARSTPAADRVPYAFEQRVMASLRARALPDSWSLWACALWRGAAPCVAIMLLLAAWSAFAPAFGPSASDFSQDFDNTVLAAVNPEQASIAPSE